MPARFASSLALVLTIVALSPGPVTVASVGAVAHDGAGAATRLLPRARRLTDGLVSTQQTARFATTVAMPAGRGLSLSITVGDVRVVGEARSDAALEIVRTAPSREGLDRIPIVIDDEPGADLRITVTQIEEDTNPAFRTDITLRVPHDAMLTSMRLLEGTLALADLRGSVDADVRRGRIAGSRLQGIIRLETGIGDVVLDDAVLSPGGLLRLRAFNGDVTLHLAERPADARVMALALNGTIASDIPLTTKDRWGPRWGEATLGKGAPVISLDVVTGRIAIKVPKVPKGA